MVKSTSEIEAKDVGAGKDTSVKVLIGPENAGNFFMRKFSMKPGGGMPLHTNKVEHEQYVLKGKGRVGIGDAIHEVGAGDILYIPAEVPHYYLAISEDENFEFLCMVPNKEDEITILDDSC